MPADGKEPNEQLDRLLRQAGFVLPSGLIGEKELARAVTRAAAAHGVQRRYTHTYVQRWLTGTNPRDRETPQYIAEAIGQQLGRPVGIDELGFDIGSTLSASLGMAYPNDVATAVSTSSSLIQADLQDIRVIIDSVPSPAGWNEAALNWLVRRPSGIAPAGNGEVPRVRNLSQLRAQIDLYKALDNQHGGAEGRRALALVLVEQAIPMLRETKSAAARGAAFRLAAEGMLTLAWMTYDAGLHGLGQRYFIQGLRIAQEGEDGELAASILDAMSHQLTFLRNHREAANLAAAARMGSMSLAAPLLEAHFWVMEARAYASMGEARACDQALLKGADLFENADPAEAPEFIRYFGQYEFDAELAHCNRDLGRPEQAVKYAESALQNGPGGFARSDFFGAMVLADAYLDMDDPERGCEAALKALDIGEDLNSARSVTYVDEFRARLKRFRNAAVVKQFNVEAAKRILWTPAA